MMSWRMSRRPGPSRGQVTAAALPDPWEAVPSLPVAPLGGAVGREQFRRRRRKEQSSEGGEYLRVFGRRPQPQGPLLVGATAPARSGSRGSLLVVSRSFPGASVDGEGCRRRRAEPQLMGGGRRFRRILARRRRTTRLAATAEAVAGGRCGTGVVAPSVAGRRDGGWEERLGCSAQHYCFSRPPSSSTEGYCFGRLYLQLPWSCWFGPGGMYQFLHILHIFQVRR